MQVSNVIISICYFIILNSNKPEFYLRIFVSIEFVNLLHRLDLGQGDRLLLQELAQELLDLQGLEA